MDRAHPVIEAPWRHLLFYLTAVLLDAALLYVAIVLLRLPVRRRPTPRRAIAPVALLGTLVILALYREGPAIWPVRTAKGPSILLITIDTMRRDHLGAIVSGKASTPTLDALAREGALFTNALSQAPLTAPSHASILSGLIPPRHGSRYNGVPMREGVATVAEILATNGYRTAAVVSSEVLSGAMSGLDSGFDLYDATFLPNAGSQQIYLLTGVKALLRLAGKDRRPERRARVAVERARSILRAIPKPCFLWLHLYDPHIPYSPPKFYRSRADPDYHGTFEVTTASVVALREGESHPTPRDLEHGRRLYRAEVEYTDASLAPLLAEAKAAGARIIVAADHGESLGEHDYTFFHGEHLYSPSMRVPLLISGKGIQKGKQVPQLVRLMDLAPTILDLASLDIPSGIDGRSLLPLLKNEDPSRVSYQEDGNRLYLMPATDRIQLKDKEVGLRSDRYNFILRPATNAMELYDLKQDPGETRNIAGRADMATTVAWFRSRLQAMTDFESYRLESVPLGSSPVEIRKTLTDLGYLDPAGSDK